MKIVFFANPKFFADQTVSEFSSMPRFTHMLTSGMIECGHNVEVWYPKATFFRLFRGRLFKKWFGYIDQYFVFPFEVYGRLNNCDCDTLFVFTDQAQGPWMPLVSNRHHVVHCHDFISQVSASGKMPENRTTISGRLYQNFIRRGISKGKHFISVSSKTQADLHQLLSKTPVISEVVYNGLTESYRPYDLIEARAIISKIIGVDLSSGYILHVGGNLWYKNRRGVLEIYNSWRLRKEGNLPLLMIGEQMPPILTKLLADSQFNSNIHVLTGITDEYMRSAYAGASVLVFPSLAEGFGWPIAEAMACGCLVITTNEPPMSEVAGQSGFFIPRRPYNEGNVESWAKGAAEVISSVLRLTPAERNKTVYQGLQNVKRFDLTTTIKSVEIIYEKIVFKRG